jgi:hypothetical protein
MFLQIERWAAFSRHIAFVGTTRSRTDDATPSSRLLERARWTLVVR